MGKATRCGGDQESEVALGYNSLRFAVRETMPRRYFTSARKLSDPPSPPVNAAPADAPGQDAKQTRVRTAEEKNEAVVMPRRSRHEIRRSWRQDSERKSNSVLPVPP